MVAGTQLCQLHSRAPLQDLALQETDQVVGDGLEGGEVSPWREGRCRWRLEVEEEGEAGREG